MSFPIPFSINVAPLPGNKPFNAFGPDNSGGTGQVPGDPSGYMQNFFNLMRKIHGTRQTMGNYASNGGTDNVYQR